MPDPGDELPEALENALYELHFESQGDARDARLEALCTTHPTLAEALRRHARALARGEQLLGQAHDDLTQATEQQRVGAFRVQRVLGEGGFGTVYLAEQEHPVRRPVALKVLQPGRVDARSRQRFEDERQVLARLQHACIAQVYDAGVTDDGLHYFAMEFVDGPPITAWCERRGADVDTRLRLFLQVCAAIHHAHQRAVVHRDIKPSNLLVAEQDGTPLPKVIDFGIAKLLAVDRTGGDVTRQGAQIGTPGYMSPEQAAGEPVDTRTDVYSLGVLLCELLTGELPFDRERLGSSNFVALARMLNDEAPRRPSELLAATGEGDAERRRRLRTDLDWIVLRAIAADRDARYTSVAALADDVERHLRREPVLARQSAASYVVGKFVQRHRLAVSTAAALVVAAVAAITLLVWGLREVGSARALAERERDVAQARDMAARMAVAQLAMDSGDVTTARGYLATVPTERQSWEWRHLVARSDTSSLCLEVGPALEAAWLDDRHVVTFPMYGDIVVWDLAAGQPARTLIDWQETFRRVVVDPKSARALIASDRALALWDLTTGRHLEDLRLLPGEPFAIAWSEDRRLAAVGGRGEWLDLVSLADAGATRRLRLETSPTAIAFLENGQLLVGDESGTIRRIDTDRNEVLARMTGHRDVVEALLVQGERDLVYSASIDSTVRAWQLSTGEPRAVLPCSGRMRRLALSTDGNLLYACGGWADSPMAAWETTGFTLRGHFLGHRSGIGSVELSPDGTRLATISRDATLRVWNAEPAPAVRRLEAGRDARVLAVDHRRTRFATASLDGRVTVWNGVTLAPELQRQTDEPWTGSALGSQEIYLAGRSVKALRLPDGSERGEGTTNGHRVESMLVTPDERWLVGGHDQHLLVWRLPELELVHELACDVGAAQLHWDAETRRVLVGCRDATVRWLDPAAGTFERQLVLAALAGGVGALGRHGDLLVAGAGRTVGVYRGDRLLRQMDASNLCGSISPDGRRLVTGAADNKVRVWDLDTLDQLLVFSDPVYTVSSVHFVGGSEHIVALAHRWEAPTYVYAWRAPRDATLPR
jgi:serine/threonine protein kinase/WD40 repeat protein